MLFQGEEWGASTPFLYFTDHQDPQLGRAVSEGRRREHPMAGDAEVPDPQDEQTFLRSKLEWSELTEEPHQSLLGWYKGLIQLRRAEPDLADLDRGVVDTSFDEDQRWLVVRRGRFSVAANLSGERQALPLPGPGSLVLSSAPTVGLEGPRAWMPPNSVAVVAH
jgi:maltooligosyltrehalose trehalohydrolase